MWTPEQLICPGCGEQVRPEPPVLQQLLAGLALDHHTHLDHHPTAGQRRELLEHTLRALDQARQLTRGLLDHTRGAPHWPRYTTSDHRL